VPGVFWCNRKINTDEPSLGDIAPRTLDLFGVEIPGYMQGASLFGERKATRRVTDKLPGARISGHAEKV
jgi:hypothetical protein